MFGMLSLSWWGYVSIALVLTHITVFCVTIYLHRCMAHRSVDLHPIVSHFCRAWLWLTTGIVTKQWVAVHRKHHAKCETKEDPHSPQILGLSQVLWHGADIYRVEASKAATLERYGHACPNDWLENSLYTAHPKLGYLMMFAMDLFLFGFAGIVIWSIQMMTIPLLAAGVVNGIGHYWGYRNFDSPDTSTNLFPVGILIGGEELHNNHHAYPTSAKFSAKWWEFDIGWGYINLLAILGLAKVKHRIPKVKQDENKNRIDFDTLRSIIKNRYQVLAQYKKMVVVPLFRRHKTKDLKLSLRFRKQLEALWGTSITSNNGLLEHLHQWCYRAELTGDENLLDFVKFIRRYA